MEKIDIADRLVDTQMDKASSCPVYNKIVFQATYLVLFNLLFQLILSLQSDLA